MNNQLPIPIARETFEINIRSLVSVLNSDNLSRETILFANEKIQHEIKCYYTYVMNVKETE